MGVRIEGVSDCLRAFDEAPDELVKAVKKALRKAVAPEARNLRKSLQPSFKKMVKSSVKSLRSGDVSAVFGMFLDSKTETKGRVGFDWFKAYWKNYGTLQGRDPAHRFDTPVKHGATTAAKRRRNNVGEMYENFYEQAVTGFEDRTFSAFKKAMKEQGYTIE